MKIVVLGLFYCCLLFNEAFSQFTFGFGGSGNNNNKPKPRPCRVPTGKSGFCVPQNQCIYIQDLIKNLQKPLPGDVALYIKDSFFCSKEAGVKRIFFFPFCFPFYYFWREGHGCVWFGWFAFGLLIKLWVWLNNIFAVIFPGPAVSRLTSSFETSSILSNKN